MANNSIPVSLHTGNASYKVCLVCCQQLSATNCHTNYFKCAPQKLSNCVQVYFVLSKVIELPEQEIVKYLKEYGSPEELLTFCANCTKNFVQKCVKLQSELNSVKRKLNIAGRQLINAIIRTKGETALGRLTDPASIVTREVREFVRNRNYPDVDEDPCVLGNSRAEELLLLSNRESLERNVVAFKVEENEEPVEFEEAPDVMVKEEPLQDFRSDYSPPPSPCPLLKQEEEQVKTQLGRSRSLRQRRPTLPAPRKGHQCSSCDATFPTQVKLKEHQKTHSTPKAFSCDICSYQCNQSRYFRLHRKKIHGIVKNYPCPTCSVDFLTNKALESHTAVKEGLCDRKIGDRWCCDKCPKTFSHRIKLKHHLLHGHLGNSLVCELCGYKTADPYAMNVHNKRFHGSEEDLQSYTCPICKKVFYSKAYLEHHKKICDPQNRDRHQCESCGKQFCKEGSLKNHLAVQHDVKEFQNYPCKMEHCGRILYSKHHLTEHEVWCSGEKDTGERKFVCSLCPRKFVQEKELKGHLKKIHGLINILKRYEAVNRGTGRKIRLSGKEYPCKFPNCGEILYSISQLRNHKVETHWIHKVGNGSMRTPKTKSSKVNASHK